MLSRLTGVASALLLLSTAGCTLDSFLVTFVGPSRKETSFSGTLTQTEETLTVALEKLNIQASRQRNGEEIRLLGRTRTGKAFALVLQQQKSDATPRTLVGIEWDKEADEWFWAYVARELLAGPTTITIQNPKPATTTTPAPITTIRQTTP